MLYGIIATQSPAVVNRQIWQLGKASYTFRCRLGALIVDFSQVVGCGYTCFLLVVKSMFVQSQRLKALFQRHTRRWVC